MFHKANYCCCSATQLCPTLCDCMDCSTPGFRVPHHLLQFARSCSLHWWCCPAILSSDTFFSFCPQFFPISGTFPMSHLFALDDQNTGASASASVLPVNIQGWSPLRFTGLISFLSKALSVGFSSSTIPGINSLAFCLLYGSGFTTVHDHWEDHSFENTDICWQSKVSAFWHTV